MCAQVYAYGMDRTPGGTVMTMHINQHIGLGNSLKETRNYLVRYISLIPANTSALRKVTQSLLVIDELSSVMEDQLSREIYLKNDPRNMIRGVYRGDEVYKYNHNHKYDPQAEDVFQGWYADEF